MSYFESHAHNTFNLDRHYVLTTQACNQIKKDKIMIVLIFWFFELKGFLKSNFELVWLRVVTLLQCQRIMCWIIFRLTLMVYLMSTPRRDINQWTSISRSEFSLQLTCQRFSMTTYMSLTFQGHKQGNTTQQFFELAILVIKFS